MFSFVLLAESAQDLFRRHWHLAQFHPDASATLATRMALVYGGLGNPKQLGACGPIIRLLKTKPNERTGRLAWIVKLWQQRPIFHR
jgi:hypothetical protein